MKLMFAYGSNLNKKQMAVRCPQARPYKSIFIDGWQLRFNGVATIERKRDSMLAGGLWWISPECEVQLDKYEGVDTGLYNKEYFDFEGKKVLVYIMRNGSLWMPSKTYFNTIRRGYEDFNLPLLLLDETLDRTKKMVYNKWYNYK